MALAASFALAFHGGSTVAFALAAVALPCNKPFFPFPTAGGILRRSIAFSRNEIDIFSHLMPHDSCPQPWALWSKEPKVHSSLGGLS